MPDNLTLLCSYHHRLLHEGGFGVEREAGGTLTFTRADGRMIPRFGHRVEDFIAQLSGVRGQTDFKALWRLAVVRLGAGGPAPGWEIRMGPAGLTGRSCARGNLSSPACIMCL